MRDGLATRACQLLREEKHAILRAELGVPAGDDLPGIDYAAHRLTGAALDVLSFSDPELAAERVAIESAVVMLSRRLERLPR